MVTGAAAGGGGAQVLEEVSSLSERLRLQAAEGRASTMQLATDVNESQV